MKIIVFGSNGQMGSIFRKIVPNKFNVIMSDRSNLDISCKSELESFIILNKPDFIFNFAAYTKVDDSEKNQDLALEINANVPLVMAQSANKIGAVFLHISTDYVYDSRSEKYLDEKTKIEPCNFYGKSKALGEKFIQESCNKYLIFRTSWLYSDIKNNFFLTIVHLIRTRKKINIINDQYGAPTLVYDLVRSLIKILEILTKNINNNRDNKLYWGIYNLSNSGETSWYNFACKIASDMGYNSRDIILPINSKDYNSLAQRPSNSRLDNSKIFRVFGIKLPHWEDSFKKFKKMYPNNS